MTKYRIRLANGRVVGPFAKNQVIELKAKGHISGKEDAQVYPTGNWGPMSLLDFYSELLDDNRTTVHAPPREDTFIIDLEAIRKLRNENEIDRAGAEQAHSVKNLTETIRMTPSEIKKELKPLDAKGAPKDAPTASQEFDLDESALKRDKTLINPVAQAEIRKMRKLQQQKELEKNKQLEYEEQEKKIKAELAQAEEVSLPEVSAKDSTQMLSLDKVRFDLMESAAEEEKQIDREMVLFEKNRQLENDEEDDEDEEEEKKPDRKKIIYLIAFGLLIYAVFYPGDNAPKKVAFQHLPPQLVFAIPFDKADPTTSKILYTKGVELFKQGKYPAIIQSGLNFKASYENDVNNLEALSFMARSYGEQLKFSKTKLNDSITFFNIVQSKRPFLIQNPNGVIGLNYFYMNIDKPDAASDVVAKYLKLNPKNVTQELFAVYLTSLIKTGQMDETRQFVIALEKAPEKNQYTYHALIEYFLLNQENEKALEYVNDALKRFPQLVQFHLLKAEMLLKTKKLDEADGLLKSASNLNLEYNDLYRARFLELSGIYWALKGDVTKANKLLTNSLAIEDSSALRMKLADLQSSQTSPGANQLIDDSKAYKLLSQAQDFFLKRNYELALSTAARATEASPGNIPAELFFSKVQLRLGHASQAIKTLEDLAQKYPADKSITVALVEAYIDTYKFNDARTRLGIMSSTEMRNTWEYYSLNGRLQLRMNDSLKAVSFLKDSIKLNPLNDRDIYLLAEVLYRRSNFEQARILLNKAIELDPINPDYRILYARLIYETEDDQAAIGYLLGLLSEFGENPKVLAEVAIFYFRAGKVKDFQDFKLRLEKIPTKDKALYEFLIKAALLDERYDEVPGLVEELLRIEPGSLESMMTAGRVLFESGKLKEAAKWFIRIKERLPTYPKVQYYGARIEFLSGNLEKALKEVNEDIRTNGESDASLVFLGEIHVQKGDMIAGENFYKKAQKINPRSYEALMGLAELSTKRNNFDLALDLYKKAMTQKSDEPLVHKKIGDVYRLLGQGTLAIEAYKLYLEMNPEAPDKKQIEAYIQLME